MTQPPAHSHAASARIPTSRLAENILRLAQELAPEWNHVVYDLEEMRKGHTTREVVQQIRKDLRKRNAPEEKIKWVSEIAADYLKEPNGSDGYTFMESDARVDSLSVILLSPASKKDLSTLPLPVDVERDPGTRQDTAYHELGHVIASSLKLENIIDRGKKQERDLDVRHLREVYADVFSALLQLLEEGEAAAPRQQQIAQWRYLCAFTDVEGPLRKNDIFFDHLTSPGIRAAIKEYHRRKNTPQALDKLTMTDIEALALRIVTQHGLEPCMPMKRLETLTEANMKLDLYIADKLPENEFRRPISDASVRRWERLKKADALPPLRGEQALIPEGERLPRAIELGFLDTRKPWLREMEKAWKARAKDVGLPPLIPFSVQPLDRSPKQPASFAERVRSRGAESARRGIDK